MSCRMVHKQSSFHFFGAINSVFIVKKPTLSSPVHDEGVKEGGRVGLVSFPRVELGDSVGA